MLFLLYLMSDTYWEIQKVYRDGGVSELSLARIKMSIWGILFGVLIEWEGLKKVLAGDVKVNWLLAPTIIFVIINLIPEFYWYSWIKVDMRLLMVVTKNQMLFNVLSGILLIRTLTK